MNNLDPEVAERPDELVVYGGIGKAARNWQCFDQIVTALREEDFIREGVEVDPDSLHAFIAPIAEPLIEDTFKFSREWLRQEAARVTDLRPTNVVRQLNLPPSYVLIHRVVAAGTGVLCQLEAEGPFRGEALRWVPGFADDDPTDEEEIAS
jgi:hypothetical protein